MRILVKENTNNAIDSSGKIVDMKIVDIDPTIELSNSNEDSGVIIGFKVISSPKGSVLSHSHDTSPEVLLNYGGSEESKMNIDLSEIGTYVIKIVCIVSVIADGEYTDYKLDDAGNLVDTKVPQKTWISTKIESSELTLEYSNDEGWI